MSRVDALLKKYKDKEYERFFEELWRKEEYKSILNKKLDVVIDVGALAGEFGAYIYDRAGIIYAIEPFTPHYRELLENINEFGLTKIKPYHIALSSQAGIAPFTTNETRGGNHLAETSNENTQEVITKTLAQFIKEEGITHVDVLKIDVEGDEEAIFNAADFKEIALLIDCIIGEHLGGKTDLFKELGFTMRHGEHGNLIFER